MTEIDLKNQEVIDHVAPMIEMLVLNLPSELHVHAFCLLSIGWTIKVGEKSDDDIRERMAEHLYRAAEILVWSKSRPIGPEDRQSAPASHPCDR